MYQAECWAIATRLSDNIQIISERKIDMLKSKYEIKPELFDKLEKIALDETSDVLGLKDFGTSDKFIVYFEMLIKSVNREFILYIEWMLNPEWAKEVINSDEMKECELGRQKKFILISEKQAEEWFKELDRECRVTRSIMVE